MAFFDTIGMERCIPYIQSGNFILRGPAELMDERRLEQAMATDLGIRTVAFLRTAARYRRLIDACPYTERAAVTNPRKLLVTFFGQPVRGDGIATLQEQMDGAALLHLTSTELYTYMLPEQEQGNFSNNALEKMVGAAATTRNWNTIQKMAQLCRAHED